MSALRLEPKQGTHPQDAMRSACVSSTTARLGVYTVARRAALTIRTRTLRSVSQKSQEAGKRGAQRHRGCDIIYMGQGCSGAVDRDDCR